MAETLTGDLIEPWLVENPDNEPDATEDPRSETYIGGTTDDIEIERDPNTADWTEHMKEQVQRRELQDSGELTLVFTLQTELDNLVDAGIVVEDTDRGIYTAQKNVRHDAIEFDVWARKTDAEPAQTYRCYDVQPVVESIPMEIEGTITVETTWWLMDDHGWVVPETTV